MWFAVAIIGHDLILFPLYSAADRSVRRLLRGRAGGLRASHGAERGDVRASAGGAVVAGPPVVNYLRVPTAFSLMLLLVWFPLILGLSGRTYRRASGLSASPYLGRWLGVTGAFFAVSAVCYAAAAARQAAARGRDAQPPRVTAARNECDDSFMDAARFARFLPTRPWPQALRRPWRWGVVVAGVAVLCATPGIVAALPVSPSPLTAAALRAKIMASAGVPYSGYVESTADLGLPQLPDLQDVSTLADGVTEQYAWYRSPEHWRAATLTTGGEDDVYSDDGTTYLFNFSLNLLTLVTGTSPVRLPRASDLLPPSLARLLLGLSSPADRLGRLPSRRIGGVNAAGLRITPASAATTVGAIDIWADPRSGLPVDVAVYPRGNGKPVLVSDFLQVSQSRPALATVTPDPAPGVDRAVASLSTLNGILNDGRHHHFWPPALGGQPLRRQAGGLSAVAFYGTGYGRLALLHLPDRTGRQAVAAATAAGAGLISVPGGSEIVVATPLLTVDLATADRFGGVTFLLAGSVTPGVLEAAAGDLLNLFAHFRPPPMRRRQ